ncbi:MAG: hypothetical protein ACPGVC_05090 [Salibacteraceae bacterium]
MNVRYFYAPAIFSSDPKLYVLTDDNVLYSETRNLSVIQVERTEVKNFKDFDPSNHQTEDHPILIEISSVEAKDITLNTQANWVKRYLLEKRVFSERALQA